MNSSAFETLRSVAGTVSRETFADLKEFEQELQRWAKRINLVSQSTLSDAWTRHILDSAQLASIEPDASRWLDLGSGAGFPGIVIGFLLKERVGGYIHLVESNRKKGSFLQSSIHRWKLPASVHGIRIEEAGERFADTQVVTARALARLPVLLTLAAAWLEKGSAGLFHKGRDYHAEVEESALLWRFDLLEHPSTVDPQGVILEIRNLRRR